MDSQAILQTFLDEEGRIHAWPSRRAKQEAVLGYLASKLEPGRDYTEREINELCQQWHTFGDLFLLRREMVEHRLVARERDGSRYWRVMGDEEIEG